LPETGKGALKSEMEEIIIMDDCPVIGKEIMNIDFPQAATIAIIKRRGEFIIPNGSTVIKQGDRLIILAETVRDLDFAKSRILSFSKKNSQSEQ
jgi:cell volume regulation protein A